MLTNCWLKKPKDQKSPLVKNKLWFFILVELLKSTTKQLITALQNITPIFKWIPFSIGWDLKPVLPYVMSIPTQKWLVVIVEEKTYLGETSPLPRREQNKEDIKDDEW